MYRVLSIESPLIWNCFYSFAASNFDPYIEQVRHLAHVIPQLKPFLPMLIKNTKMGEAAVKSGNKDEMVKALAEGAKNIEVLAPLLESYPKLYKLAKLTPAIAKKLSADIKQGKKGPNDLNNVIGYYNGQVKANLM